MCRLVKNTESEIWSNLTVYVDCQEISKSFLLWEVISPFGFRRLSLINSSRLNNVPNPHIFDVFAAMEISLSHGQSANKGAFRPRNSAWSQDKQRR